MAAEAIDSASAAASGDDTASTGTNGIASDHAGDVTNSPNALSIESNESVAGSAVSSSDETIPDPAYGTSIDVAISHTDETAAGSAVSNSGEAAADHANGTAVDTAISNTDEMAAGSINGNVVGTTTPNTNDTPVKSDVNDTDVTTTDHSGNAIVGTTIVDSGDTSAGPVDANPDETAVHAVDGIVSDVAGDTLTDSASVALNDNGAPNDNAASSDSTEATEITAPPKPAIPVISLGFTDNSDLTLIVENKDVLVKYQVSSGNVASVSQIWRQLLDSNKENKPADGGNWVIKVDGVEPKTLSYLLRIVHYQFRMVPAKLDLNELYNLTLITHRFDCMHLIQPWAVSWVTRFAVLDSDDEYWQQGHKAIWFSWELGHRKLFQDTVDALLVSCQVDADGDLANVRGEKLKDMVLPSGILDLIARTRRSTIESMLKAVHDPIVELTTGVRNPEIRYCHIGKDIEKCEAMLLGSAIPELIKLGLYPVPDANAFKGSINQLREAINSIKLITFVGLDWKPHSGHHHCNLKFHESMANCVRNMPFPTGKQHMEHLKHRAMLNGLYDGVVNKRHVGPARSFRKVQTGDMVINETFLDKGPKNQPPSIRRAPQQNSWFKG